MKSFSLLLMIIVSFFSRVFQKIGMVFSVGWLLAMKRMNTVVTIVEHTHQNIELVNGHIIDFSFPEHHYEVKFSGNKAEELERGFIQWMKDNGGEYAFSKALRKNEGAKKPDEFHCLCSATEAFLMGASFKKFPVSNKFHVFVR